MKRLLSALIVTAFIGTSPVFAADSETRHKIDDQKLQAKNEYEQQKNDLKAKYSGDELEQRLQKAYNDYVSKAKELDQKKKEGPDPEDVTTDRY